MNIDVNNISAVVGVLGAYFAILLVLSVSVETILEPFSLFRGLQKPLNPEEVLNSIQEWLPEGSGEAAKVVAIQTYASKTKTDLEALDRAAHELTNSAIKILEGMNLGTQVNAAQKEIAIKLAILQERYDTSQRRRITLLRALSALIGMVIAYVLDINTFNLLGSMFSDQIIASLSTPIGHYGGVIITGLAASAGSSFWHDMIGRARNIKDAINQVEDLTSGSNEAKG